MLTLANAPRNQISEQVVDDPVEVVAALETAGDVRALLVRGEGDVFSAGADVNLLRAASATTSVFIGVSTSPAASRRFVADGVSCTRLAGWLSLCCSST